MDRLDLDRTTESRWTKELKRNSHNKLFCQITYNYSIFKINGKVYWNELEGNVKGDFLT